MSAVANFSIEWVGFIGADGEAVAPLPSSLDNAEALRALYEALVLTRTFDAKAVSLQRTGRLGTFASSLGQEAVGVGVAGAMQSEDVLLPSFREQGAQLMRGVRIEELLLYWGGDERGSDFRDCREDFPVSIPVGSHAPHASGVALAFKLRGEPRVAVCMFGDGATSKGDVYEAMNFAGIHRLPVVFVVSNNQWAISVARKQQSAAQTLAQKAVAAGFEGVQVDGNDVSAVQHVTAKAVEKARTGGGPTLVEALTYRLGDHTTADDAGRYRDDALVSAQWRADPVSRLRTYMTHARWWAREDEEQLIHACAERVESAVAIYLATPRQSPGAMFDHLYESLPAVLGSQRTRCATRGGGEAA